ncbi:MAG TPA: TetR/AcrR family transcriptional regulator [Candidatus Binatia bacterium]|nr:TetR/AcrR family transcriptional regulator [Candidatus Binatia bacterium]
MSAAAKKVAARAEGKGPQPTSERTSSERSASGPNLPPRARIVTAASELFYRHGIRAVSVDAIAEAAGTNKMTLYRHFPSKDALVAEYLRALAREANAHWDEIARECAGDPQREIGIWLNTVAECVTSDAERGCALANAAVELPEKDHPARAVIEEFKTGHRERLAQLFRSAGLSEPEVLADEIFLLIEGARINIQSVGPDGPASRLVRMIEALIKDHKPAA